MVGWLIAGQDLTLTQRAHADPTNETIQNAKAVKRWFRSDSPIHVRRKTDKQLNNELKHTKMSVKLKPAGKLFIIAAVIAAGIVSVRWYQSRPRTVGQSIELGKVALPDVADASLS